MSLTLLLDMAVSGYADRIALGRSDDGVTYQALARRAAGGAAVLRAEKASSLVYIGRNAPCYPQLLFAAATAGLPFVPVNYRLSADGLRDLVAQADSPLVVAEDDYLPLVEDEFRCVSTADFLAAADAADPIEAVPVDGSDTALLLFTSGTTSKPKAVVLRHENLFAYITSTVEFASADPEDAALVTVPPYHIAAVGSALSNLYAGRRIAYLPDFDAREWLRLVRDECVSTAMVVPTMLARVTEALDGARADAPALSVISYGGAKMPRPVLEAALRAFPGVGFVNAYGLTETSSTIALLGPEDHTLAFTSDDERIRRRLGSVGRPVPGVEVLIRDEGGRSVPAGTPGQLWVRGAQVSGEYRGHGSALDPDGWFDTRDQAHLDEDGYLYIEGRSDDTIIRGGENIAPAEIEDVLQQHPAVSEVAVLGRPDEEWGEKIVAFVVTKPSARVDEESLRTFVRERLRGSRTPDEIVWRHDLPYSATGKLLRRELRQELQDPVALI